LLADGGDVFGHVFILRAICQLGKRLNVIRL
jgi:hypothetical protein